MSETRKDPQSKMKPLSARRAFQKIKKPASVSAPAGFSVLEGALISPCCSRESIAVDSKSQERGVIWEAAAD